jgi:cob(I)alamin adenosyltransferase
MGELACAEADAARHAKSKFARLAEGDLRRLDEFLAALESRGIRLDGWATPGANPEALAFDRARVAARRAERRLAALPPAVRTVRPLLLQWTNRLSDLLWLLAREAEARGGPAGA